jgi:hypothetical protein
LEGRVLVGGGLGHLEHPLAVFEKRNP